MFKKFASDYFAFTKKERVGTIGILSLIVIMVSLPFLYSLFHSQKKVEKSAMLDEIEALKTKQKDSSNQYAKRYDKEKRNYRHYYNNANEKSNSNSDAELFEFDPNTASVEDWQRLGIRDKTIATIQNYIGKGGRFYLPEDINKIWGLRDDEKERLLPYIRIAAREKTAYEDKKYTKKVYDKPAYSTASVDINSADSNAFIALPGIGSKLAKRIIAFREKLGGFNAVEQIAETYALPDSTFQKIKTRLIVTNGGIKQFDINKASVDEMKGHPYIRYALANIIVQYRTAHGNFAAVADIKKMMTVTDDVFRKAAPYLKVN